MAVLPLGGCLVLRNGRRPRVRGVLPGRGHSLARRALPDLGAQAKRLQQTACVCFLHSEHLHSGVHSCQGQIMLRLRNCAQ